MRWHTVLFDLDGTLTDPKEGITRAFAYALRHYGVDADPDGLGCVIGPPLKDSFMELYGFSAQQAVEAIGKYREYYGSRGWAENVPYPGIGRMLAGLNAAGLTLAVATSKPEKFSVRILEHFGLAEHFRVICGAPMDTSDRGRKEYVVADALARCGCPDGEGAVMVGDRSHDVAGAHRNGLPAVGVLYGYGSRAELESAGAEFITQSVQSLGALLTDRGS